LPNYASLLDGHALHKIAPEPIDVQPVLVEDHLSFAVATDEVD
jgi:hypothetical protein